LDRGTDRPDGSGGGTPTVVTSTATDDDLIGDEETRPTGVMAPPRLPSSNPAAAGSASADAEPDDAVSGGPAGGGVSANGVPASRKDSSANGGPAAVDDTIVDGVPALPADTIGAARGARPKGSDPAQEKGTPASAVDDSPAGNFGPSAPISSFAPASADRSGADPAKPSGGDNPEPAAPTSAAPPGVRSPGSGPSGFGSAAPASSGTVPPVRPSPHSSSVSPAAFAWEMPDPSASSPSSPTRNFLRSALTIGAASKAGPSGDTGQTAVGEGPATARGPVKQAPPQVPPPQAPAPKAQSQKAQSQKAQSKRTARQAHLTVARVEPWSVMKFSFVVSLVAFVILFVAVSLLYSVLSAVGVFESLQHVVTSLTSSQGSVGVNAKTWFSASRVLGYTALLGSLNIVLITAMATIGSVVYNLTSRLVGGVEVTLRETE
jgi:Transmembrane domain of unknown function (DUF3566)